jgi:uncharacterized membrane protein
VRLHHDESGMVGKVIVIWLLMVALLGVVALDGASIMLTKFRLDDAAGLAASAAATAFRNGSTVAASCDAARQAALDDDAGISFPSNTVKWCKVDTQTGEFTITLHKQANTILAGRLSFTKNYARVVQKETAGPATL